MHRAALANKFRTELLEYSIDGEQDSPKFRSGFRIVGSMLAVLIEPDGVWNFNRHRPDFYVDARGLEHGETFLIKVGYGTRLKGKLLHDCIASLENQLVLDEIETKLE